jgi:hypothetical protein
MLNLTTPKKKTKWRKIKKGRLRAMHAGFDRQMMCVCKPYMSYLYVVGYR